MFRIVHLFRKLLHIVEYLQIEIVSSDGALCRVYTTHDTLHTRLIE